MTDTSSSSIQLNEYKLGNLAKIKGGKRLPLGENLTDVPNGHPYIRTRDISNHKIKIDNLLYVPDDTFPFIKNYIVEKNDIIVSIVGTIGLCAIVPRELHLASLTENCVKIVEIDTATLDKTFLYYYLISQDGQDEIQKRNVGSTQPKLPLYNIKDIPIPILPVKEQKAIASLLSSLDDKINLLQRQNKTLEEMAVVLFRENFIEKDNKKWDVGIVDDILTVKGGSTPSTGNAEFWDGNIFWTTPRDLANNPYIYLFNTERKITEKGLKQISSGLLPVGTILLSSRAPIGYLAITEIPTAINQGFIAILGNKGFPKEFIYLWLKYNMDMIISNANGSVFLEISKSVFRNLEISIPPKQLIYDFNGKIMVMFEKIKLNSKQINILENLRNSLLQKLMSGAIKVNGK